MAIFIIFMVFIFTSCSTSSQKSRSGSDTVVTKSEYDMLLKKYEELQEEARDLRNYQRESAKKFTKEEMGIGNGKDFSSESEVVETVSVFDEKREVSSHEVVPGKIEFIDDLSEDNIKDLERSIFDLKRAQAALEKQDYHTAMELLKVLQESPYRQVQVRAQYFVGEVFFMQGEYDIAMQAYEDIIHRSAFSGYVLKALPRLITCSEKLGIVDKKDKYHSILYDFFEGA